MPKTAETRQPISTPEDMLNELGFISATYSKRIAQLDPGSREEF